MWPISVWTHGGLAEGDLAPEWSRRCEKAEVLAEEEAVAYPRSRRLPLQTALAGAGPLAWLAWWLALWPRSGASHMGCEEQARKQNAKRSDKPLAAVNFRGC